MSPLGLFWYHTMQEKKAISCIKLFLDLDKDWTDVVKLRCEQDIVKFSIGFFGIPVLNLISRLLANNKKASKHLGNK